MTRSSAIACTLLFSLVGCDARDADPELDRAHLVDDTDVCDLVAYPSVFVVPMRRYDDFGLQVDVDAVWYEHEGETFEATCLFDRTDGCRAWVAGWEREGPVRVFTEYCDAVVDAVVTVPIDDTGCHVVTQYLQLEVLTRGCLTNEIPTPPPTGPLPL